MVDSPTDKNPGRQVVVKTPEEHERLFPEDFKIFQAIQSGDPTGGRATFLGQASATDERERCAIVAETYPKAGKLGALIAAAIRGQLDDVFPKLLRNPQTSPVKGGNYTAPGVKDDTYLQPDVKVDDPEQEAAARAKGFTVIVSPPAEDAPKGTIKDAPKDAGEKFPKILRDPRTQEAPDVSHTEIRDGRYARADVSVANPAEETAAIAKGYTLPLPPK
jgi:hypothetical protein